MGYVKQMSESPRLSTFINKSINNLTDLTLDHVFHTNITTYCQQNWYVQFAIYTDLFTLTLKEET